MKRDDRRWEPASEAQSLPPGVSIADEQLMQRVRRTIQEIIPEANGVIVVAKEGQVGLSGPVRADQVQRLLGQVARIPEVNAIENHLTPS